MKKLEWKYDELTTADGTPPKYIYNLMLGNESLCQLIVEKGTSQVSYYYGDSKFGSTIGDLSTDTIDEIKAKALQYTEDLNDEKLQEALLHATKWSHINNLIDLELSGVSQEMITLDSTIEFLNGLLAYDRQAVTDLLNARVTANQEMVDHPTVQAGENSIGFLGVLNGLFGVNEAGWGRITANLEQGVIKNFCRTGETMGLVEEIASQFYAKADTSHLKGQAHLIPGQYHTDPANIKDAFEDSDESTPSWPDDHSTDGLYQ